jgi:hypothetical protein
MNSLFERLRDRRLASVFVLLATLTAAIVAGSFAAHGVRGQEKKSDSADATPLHVVDSTVAPNAYVKIAREVGPAVVNINTETLPKQSAAPRKRNPMAASSPRRRIPTTIRMTIRGANRVARTTSRTSSISSSVARSPTRRAPMTAACASPSAQASSSTPKATSSPTIT